MKTRARKNSYPFERELTTLYIKPQKPWTSQDILGCFHVSMAACIHHPVSFRSIVQFQRCDAVCPTLLVALIWSMNLAKLLNPWKKSSNFGGEMTCILIALANHILDSSEDSTGSFEMVVTASLSTERQSQPYSSSDSNPFLPYLAHLANRYIQPSLHR